MQSCTVRALTVRTEIEKLRLKMTVLTRMEREDAVIFKRLLFLSNLVMKIICLDGYPIAIASFSFRSTLAISCPNSALYSFAWANFHSNFRFPNSIDRMRSEIFGKVPPSIQNLLMFSGFVSWSYLVVMLFKI